MNTQPFRMRILPWILLTLLGIMILVVLAPNLYQPQTELLQSIGIGLALLVLLLGLWLVRRMGQRLARLARVAHAIGQGDYDTRADDTRNDAIGQLGRAINAMAKDIQQAVTQLEAQQVELQSNRSKLAEQHSQLSREYQRQSGFGDFLKSLNTVDINTISDKGLDYIMNIAGAQLGQIYVCDGHKLLKITENGIDRSALGQLVDKAPEQGLPGEVLTRKQPIIVQPIDAQSFPAINLGIASLIPQSVLGLPILFQDHILGVAIMATLHTPDETRLRSVQNAIDALGSALSNALTYKTVQQQALRLEQANQELLEADRLRNEFVANMSHELRTPLNSVIGFSSLLMKNRQQNLSDKDLGHAERINRNGKHLLALINDILDLSKIEAGRMDLEFRPVRVVAIAREVVDLLSPQAHAAHIDLTLQVQDPIPQIQTDSDKLKQVLINLIGNAIKFTAEGTVSVHIQQTGSAALTIRVSDTGIGIPKNKLDTIFEPFRQADSSTSRQYGGTGLGLTISRSIIQLLGGCILVQSQTGEGSTFSIELPLTPETLSPLQTPSVTAGNDTQLAMHPRALDHDRHKGTILVVDDDQDARSLLSHYVKEAGWQIITATDGEQALEQARRHKPNLITLDLMMPGMDGWETLRRLKADPELLAIPVVIISIVVERRQALVLGAVEALTKPIIQDELLAILQRSLQNTTSNRILIVDDNTEVQDLFANLLNGRVRELRSAANGREALEVLNHYRPDLIFLDLMMPEMDGLTFLRALRMDKQLMNLPVVVVTAKQLSTKDRRELEMRVVQIIQKGEDNLEEQLEGVLATASRRHT